MKFPAYFDPLSFDEKKKLARRAKTSVIYLYHLASGKKRPSLRMAEKIQNASHGAVPIQDWQRNGGRA